MKNGIQPNKNAFFCSFLKDFLEKICWNQKKCVPLHPQMRNRLLFIVGAIAQLVEQRTENPCVPGSIPGGTTSKSRISEMKFGFLFVFTRKRLRLKVVIVCRNL